MIVEKPEATSWSAPSWTSAHEARLGYTFLRLMAQGTRMQADQNLLSTISSWVQHAPTTVLSPEILDFVHALDTAVVRSSSSTIDEIGLLRQVEQNQSRFAGAISLLDFLRIVIAERGDESVEIHV